MFLDSYKVFVLPPRPEDVCVFYKRNGYPCLTSNPVTDFRFVVSFVCFVGIAVFLAAIGFSLVLLKRCHSYVRTLLPRDVGLCLRKPFAQTPVNEGSLDKYISWIRKLVLIMCDEVLAIGVGMVALQIFGLHFGSTSIFDLHMTALTALICVTTQAFCQVLTLPEISVVENLEAVNLLENFEVGRNRAFAASLNPFTTIPEYLRAIQRRFAQATRVVPLRAPAPSPRRSLASLARTSALITVLVSTAVAPFLVPNLPFELSAAPARCILGSGVTDPLPNVHPNLTMLSKVEVYAFFMPFIFVPESYQIIRTLWFPALQMPFIFYFWKPYWERRLPNYALWSVTFPACLSYIFHMFSYSIARISKLWIKCITSNIWPVAPVNVISWIWIFTSILPSVLFNWNFNPPTSFIVWTATHLHISDVFARGFQLCDGFFHMKALLLACFERIVALQECPHEQSKMPKADSQMLSTIIVDLLGIVALNIYYVVAFNNNQQAEHPSDWSQTKLQKIAETSASDEDRELFAAGLTWEMSHVEAFRLWFMFAYVEEYQKPDNLFTQSDLPSGENDEGDRDKMIADVQDTVTKLQNWSKLYLYCPRGLAARLNLIGERLESLQQDDPAEGEGDSIR